MQAIGGVICSFRLDGTLLKVDISFGNKVTMHLHGQFLYFAPCKGFNKMMTSQHPKIVHKSAKDCV